MVSLLKLNPWLYDRISPPAFPSSSFRVLATVGNQELSGSGPLAIPCSREMSSGAQVPQVAGSSEIRERKKLAADRVLRSNGVAELEADGEVKEDRATYGRTPDGTGKWLYLAIGSF